MIRLDELGQGKDSSSDNLSVYINTGKQMVIRQDELHTLFVCSDKLACVVCLDG